MKGRGFGNTKKIWCVSPNNLQKVSELYTEENVENIKAYLIVHIVIKSAEYMQDLFSNHQLLSCAWH